MRFDNTAPLARAQAGSSAEFALAFTSLDDSLLSFGDLILA